MFDISQFRTTTALEDLSVRLLNQSPDFIAESIAPHYPVKHRTGKLYQYDQSHLRRIKTKKSSKSEADKIDFGAFTTPFSVSLHKLGAEVDPQDEMDVDPVVADLQATAVEGIMSALMIDYEKEVYDMATTSANYPSANVISMSSGVNRWSDDGSDPVGDLKVARAAVRASSGLEPNSLAISWEALEALKVNKSLIDRIKPTSRDLTLDSIQALLGVQNLFVGKAIYNTANEGGTDARSTIWGNSGLLFYKNPAPGKRTVDFMRTFVFEELYSQAYEDVKRGAAKRIQVVENGWWYAPAFIAVQSSASAVAVAGYLFQNLF